MATTPENNGLEGSIGVAHASQAQQIEYLTKKLETVQAEYALKIRALEENLAALRAAEPTAAKPTAMLPAAVVPTVALEKQSNKDTEGKTVQEGVKLEKENVDALCDLGFNYVHGFGVPENDKLAFDAYAKAAQLKDPDAICNLGFFYVFGHGVESDLKKAADLFQQAADLDHAQAQYNLGEMYLKGKGVEQDKNIAIDLFKKAALKGNTDAMFKFGRYTHSKEWIVKASLKGHALAQCELGVLYLQGLYNTAKNQTKASYWLVESVTEGNNPAAAMYLDNLDRDWRSQWNQLPPVKGKFTLRGKNG